MDPFFYKQAFDTKDIYPYAKPALILGGMLGIPKLIDMATKKGIDTMAESMREIARRDVEDTSTEKLIGIAKDVGGIPTLPHFALPGYNNAAYIPPGIIDKDDEAKIEKRKTRLRESEDPRDLIKAKFLEKSLEFSRNPSGGIIIGSEFNNPAVVAHEIGHAIINEQGGINQAIQRHSNKLQEIGLPISAAGAVTSLFAPKVGDYMLYGGLGTFGLGALGKIYNEYSASKHAKEIMDKTDELTPDRERLLNYALATYGIKNAGSAASQLSRWGIGKMI